MLGWFSKKRDGGEKALQKARRLSGQEEWAEALLHYEEALAAGADCEEARQGRLTCRQRLVELNVEKALSFSEALQPEKAKEHARLAWELAAGEPALERVAKEALDAAGRRAGASSSPQGRLFLPGCACAAPCGPEAGAAMPEEAADPEDLFEFYIEGLTPVERQLLEPLGEVFHRGYSLVQQGETAAARPLLEAAADEAPEAPGVSYALGLLHLLEGDLANASDYFSRALDTAPWFRPAAHHLAHTLRETGGLDQATRFLKTWSERNPEDREAPVLLAACRIDASDADGAMEAIEAALKTHPPGDPRLQILLARALRLRGENAKAVDVLQGVLAKRPDLVDALVVLGQILIETGEANAQKAVAVFERCYRIDREKGWWYLLRIASAYATTGLNDEAREVLMAAQSELPDGPEARAEWEAVRAATGD